MGETIFEVAYETWLGIKARAMDTLDRVRPKILLRKPLSAYQPRVYAMELTEVLDILGYRGRVRVTY